jgi:UDP-GlcNAc:undecaprenyl-phosphate GlcNAc-1-phosphate transferase
VGVFLGAASVVLALLAAKRWGVWRDIPMPSGGPAIALAAVLFLSLGVVDDLLVLSAGMKFAGQAAIAALAVALGIMQPLTGYRIADAAICWFWIVMLVNAFNLTDVCDGLVGGLSVILFACIAWVHPLHTPWAMILAGACVGFLIFNIPPASIFLGDAGSHLLGFLVAALLLSSPTGLRIWPHIPQAVLIAGVPLFELAFLIAIRTRKGLRWWKGSPDHFSLRLQAAGLSRWQTDGIAWGTAAALGVAAASLELLGPVAGSVLLAAAAGGLALCWRALLRWEVKSVGAGVSRAPAPG